ncbi:MAG TPA: hypothetical protein VGS19_30745 [Streptosporangiaceae bacterium]|nr:hypothetical protein [Streptosporangiaceae bacterium]
MTVLVLAVAAGVAALYHGLNQLQPELTGPGCAAGNSHLTIPLDSEQAAIAATIAGVAHRQHMPAHAVTVAYATAMQESHMHNLDYGDRDSVGVFQQRPSEGWGPASKLIDPVYATTRFFAALAAVHNYKGMPVYQAAQDVQHSADGYAYSQYQPMAARLTAAFTGRLAHAVWCWPGDPGTAKASLTGAASGLTHTFGALRIRTTTPPRDVPTLTVTASDPALGWAVAAWLVTHAATLHLAVVSYDGFRWRSAASNAQWVKDTGADSATAVRTS